MNSTCQPKQLVLLGIAALLSAQVIGAQGRPVKPDWRPAPPEHSDWTELYYADNAVPPEPAAEEKDRGFMLYSRHYTSLIFDNSVPHGDDKAERLSCRASLGEYESVTFAAYALRDLGAVSVRAGDLQKTGGAQRIPASAIKVQVVEHQHKRLAERAQRHPPPRREFMYMPSWLFERQQIDLHATQSAWFWITVQVPADAEPGTYTGNVTVSVGGRDQASLPLEVEVLPIRLAELRGYNIGYYVRTKAERPTSTQAKFPPWPLEDRFAELKAYGSTTVNIVVHILPEARLDAQGKLQVEIIGSEFEHAMEAYTNTGFAAPPGLSLGGRIMNQLSRLADRRSIAYSEYYLSYMQQLKAECDRRGWQPPIINPMDEVTSHNWPRTYIARNLRLIKQAGFYTELNHYLAYPHNNAEMWRPATLPFLDVINIIYSTGMTPQRQAPWKDCVKIANENGKTLWIYNSLQPGSVQPNSWRFWNGWFMRSFGQDVTGILYYVMTDPHTHPGNNLQDFRGDRDSETLHCWYPPDPDNGMPGGPGIDVACLREGVDDLRYIVTLEHLIRDARDIYENSGPVNQVANEAQDMLKSILDSFDFSNAPHIKIPTNGTCESEWLERGERDGLPTVSGDYVYANGWTGADYDRARQRVADQILKFHRVIAKEGK